MKKLTQLILSSSIFQVIVELTKITVGKYNHVSYAQEGEDRILARLMNGKKTGFFIDVGAHHPIRFSNTYLFYKLGWSGINIDATPGSMKLFQILRSRDINLEVAVATESKSRELIIFNEPALNSFDKELSTLRADTTEYRILRVAKTETHRLEDILNQHIEISQEIDFLSIDVEGLDLEVLQSNNWDVFRPKYVLVECLNLDFDKMNEDKIFTFMNNQKYKLISKTFYTAIFQDWLTAKICS